ncbi:helix-turn-helix domain-containing protein [Carnobacterium gallinarum]|uniref:helix-turn-helix domain-containing protein n=1 Tax=Carnobacterium gallinarum TaxID=2749 RepID=UPI0005575ADC|nr:helix-turn-helix domain-containing protein [Carnobacterium gallinarum]
MEQLSYLEYLLFSLFSTKKSRKAMTVYHIVSGKRTASILYQAEIYQLSAYFSLFSKLKKEQYQKIIEKGITLKLLIYENEEQLLLTEKGVQWLETYFSSHHLPVNLNLLHYGRWVNEFWRRVLFLSQVLSEIRYENKGYLPIEKEWRIQIWVKSWLQKQKLERSLVAKDFGAEWLNLGSTLSEQKMTILVGYLSGYNTIGQTTQQLATSLATEPSEISVSLVEALCEMIVEIQQNKVVYPLLYQIQAELEQSIGAVSQSIRKTEEELKNGLSLEDITQMRQLKLSTVSEHMIELAIIDPKFSVRAVIKNQPFVEVSQLLQVNPSCTYTEIKEQFPEVPFYVYRIVQLERWRADNE